jgi:hypothetical protein
MESAATVLFLLVCCGFVGHFLISEERSEVAGLHELFSSQLESLRAAIRSAEVALANATEAGDSSGQTVTLMEQFLADLRLNVTTAQSAFEEDQAILADLAAELEGIENEQETQSRRVERCRTAHERQLQAIATHQRQVSLRRSQLEARRDVLLAQLHMPPAVHIATAVPQPPRALQVDEAEPQRRPAGATQRDGELAARHQAKDDVAGGAGGDDPATRADTLPETLGAIGSAGRRRKKRTGMREGTDTTKPKKSGGGTGAKRKARLGKDKPTDY